MMTKEEMINFMSELTVIITLAKADNAGNDVLLFSGMREAARYILQGKTEPRYQQHLTRLQDMNSGMFNEALKVAKEETNKLFKDYS